MAAWPTLAPLTADADLATAFQALGQKGNGATLHALATRPACFGEPRTTTGHIGAGMLADRLRGLLDTGLVTHDRLPPGPAAHTLTADGRDLLPALEQIRSWAEYRTP